MKSSEMACRGCCKQKLGKHPVTLLQITVLASSDLQVKDSLRQKYFLCT